MTKVKFYLCLLGLVLVLTACQSQDAGTPPPTETFSLPTLQPTFTFPPPTPTATFIPTPTASGLVRLRETFDAAGSTCLTTFVEEGASAEVVDGVFRMTASQSGSLSLADCESVAVEDFVIEFDATVKQIPAGGGDYYYGLAFRISGDEFYAFVLGSAQNYCAFYALGTSFIFLTNSTDFDAACWVRIPRAAQEAETQHIKVVGVLDRLDFYVNGMLMGVVRDHKISQGWIGLIMATAAEGGLVVEFDNLVVSEP